MNGTASHPDPQSQKKTPRLHPRHQTDMPVVSGLFLQYYKFLCWSCPGHRDLSFTGSLWYLRPWHHVELLQVAVRNTEQLTGMGQGSRAWTQLIRLILGYISMVYRFSFIKFIVPKHVLIIFQDAYLTNLMKRQVSVCSFSLWLFILSILDKTDCVITWLYRSSLLSLSLTMYTLHIGMGLHGWTMTF